MSTDMQTATLTSLAMLKVNLDVRQQDYIDYLVPFVSHVLATRRPNPVTDVTVRDYVRELFGLIIPTRGVQLVLRRLVKRGYLRLDHGVFHACADIPSTDIPSRQETARQQMSTVVDALVKYAAGTFDVSWTIEDATAALLRFMKRFSIDCLRTFEQGTALPLLKRGTTGDLHVVNSFVRSAHDHDTVLFERLLVLVKGHMLANALICPDLESLQRKFDRVTFYFDTPLVLRLLRLQSVAEYDSTADLIQLLQALKAKIAVFEHTAEEVHRVITWAEENLENPHARGRIVTEMRRQSRTRSDLALARVRLNDSLVSLGLTRKPTPSYDAAFQIDETVLEGALDTDVRYANPRALEYDINSVRSVYALRKGSAPFRLEEAVAVLVTSNSKFANVAYEYGKEHEATREVSSVITDYSLANVAWLKAPLGAPGLPARELMAMCYAALEPGPELWAAYIREIDKLEKADRITARDHELLRSSLRARDELMNLTMGDESALTGETVTQILERVKSELLREKDQQVEAERAAHGATQAQRDVLTQEREQIQQRLYWGSSRIARWIARMMMVLAALTLGVSGFLSPLATSNFFNNSFWLTGVLNTIILLGIGWGVVSGLFGWSIKDVVDNVERRLQNRLLVLLCRALGIARGSNDAVPGPDTPRC